MCWYNGRMYKQVHSLMCFHRLAKISLVHYCQDVVLFNAYPRNCKELVCPQQVILYKLLMFIVMQGNGATGNNNHMWKGKGRGSGSGNGIGVSNFDLYLDIEEFSNVPQCCGYGVILFC